MMKLEQDTTTEADIRLETNNFGDRWSTRQMVRDKWLETSAATHPKSRTPPARLGDKWTLAHPESWTTPGKRRTSLKRELITPTANCLGKNKSPLFARKSRSNIVKWYMFHAFSWVSTGFLSENMTENLRFHQRQQQKSSNFSSQEPLAGSKRSADWRTVAEPTFYFTSDELATILA